MIEKKKVFIITAERYSTWYERGLLEIAKRLARAECEVRYINISDDFETKDVSFREALNMDGKAYGFLMALTDMWRLEAFLSEYYGHEKEWTLISDCMLPILKGKIIPDYFVDSLKCRQRNAYIYKKIMKKSPFLAIKGMRFLCPANSKIIDTEDLREKKLLTLGFSDDDIAKEREEYYGDILKRITD